MTTPTVLPDIKIIDLRTFKDDRGLFMESYNERVFKELYGIDLPFVQDNHSFSVQHVLRGLHYQIDHPQGKLVRVVVGTVFDVAVDLRKSSPTFGQWMGMTLHAKDHQVVWIPPGFAHGFLTLSPEAIFLYKATDFYDPQGEKCILWNDPLIGINWPLQGITPLISAKDQQGKPFTEAETFR